MPEYLKLAMASLFFAVTASVLLIMPGSPIHRLFGVLSVFMAVAGAVTAFQKSRGREFRDLFPRSNVAPNGKIPTAAEVQSRRLHASSLSPQGLKQLEQALSALGKNGVFAPEVPPAAMLREAVADYGEPVTVESVLHALDEASYYHPEFYKVQFDQNLVFFSGDCEQDEMTIRQQIKGLISL